MDELNPDSEENKVYETELGPGEDAAGFSALAQKDKFLGGSSEQKKSTEKKVQTKTYEVDSTPIEVNLLRLSPQKSKEGVIENPQKAVVFFPGWSMEAGSSSAGKLGQAFANESNTQAFIVDPRVKQLAQDSLYKEATAFSMFLRQTGVKNVVISGHSEGGIRAVDLAVILQKQKEAGETDISVDGVVLMESVGLYDQGNAVKFAANFAKDGIIDAQRETFGANVSKREGILETERRTAKLTMDVVFGTLKEIAKSNIKYPQKLLSQIREMKGIQTHLSELKSPLILVNGKDDLVSKPEKILPGYQDEDNREKALQEQLFPNSPYIRMVTADRLATHGLPVYRADQVAKTSLYLLDRYKREEQAPVVAAK